MWECLEPLIPLLWGNGSCGPRSSRSCTEASTEICSSSVKVFHHSSNSLVYSTSQTMPRLSQSQYIPSMECFRDACGRSGTFPHFKQNYGEITSNAPVPPSTTVVGILRSKVASFPPLWTAKPSKKVSVICEWVIIAPGRAMERRLISSLQNLWPSAAQSFRKIPSTIAPSPGLFGYFGWLEIRTKPFSVRGQVAQSVLPKDENQWWAAS